MALVKWPFHPSDWCSACHPVSHPAARVPRVGIRFPRLPSGCASQEESPAFKQAYSFQVASRSSRVFNLQNVVLLFDLSSKLELLIGPFFCCCFFFKLCPFIYIFPFLGVQFIKAHTRSQITQGCVQSDILPPSSHLNPKHSYP